MENQLSIFNRNESYKQILDNLPEAKAKVFNAFVILKKASNRKVANFLGVEVNRVTGRCKELRKDGLLIDAGSVWDEETQRNVTLFKVPDKAEETLLADYVETKAMQKLKKQ